MKKAMKPAEKILNKQFGIDTHLIKLAEEAERDISSAFERIDEIAEYNQYKVLEAFQKNRISESHFSWTTGYGLFDSGRDAVERVFASVFGAEKAIVRSQIVCGTHAIATALLGLLRAGDELIYCTGVPYDTIQMTIGLTGDGIGSLKEYGVSYNQIELTDEGYIDQKAVKNAINSKTKLIAIQRATGYAERRALNIAEIASLSDLVHDIDPNIIVFVDNCYGEFLDTIEPTEAGADVMAGSLIKNPGGGLALAGGYIAGRSDLIDRISSRLTCPGIGAELGLTFGQTRTMLQGLFLAPIVTASAIKGAVFCARLFEKLGYYVSPAWDEPRSDIIETIKLGSPEAMKAFCAGIQAASPIDSYITPVPEIEPGYEDEVIMAAGAFIQGSSIELSADGPMREPYNIYFQGGLTYEYSKIGALSAAQRLLNLRENDIKETRKEE